MTSAPQSFAEASRVERVTETTFRTQIPPGWEQGRGAYGGIVVAVAIRAMEAVEPTGAALRALSAEIPSPVLSAVPTEIRVETLRRGKSLASLEAKLVQEGEVKARATGLFGATRPVELAWEPSPPELLRDGSGDWEAAPVIPNEASSVPFVRHFEQRFVAGIPFSGSEHAEVGAWVRPAVPLPRWGAAEVAALADVLYPAFFPRLRGPRPAATIAYNLHLTPVAQTLDPVEPLYYQARCHQVGAGYAFELRELWTASGALVALNPQTFAVIK